MRMTCNLPDHAAAVNALLEGFVRVCQLCIASGLAPAHPRDANVKYKLEPAGEEDWKLPQNVIRDGWGDCEDMAGWAAGGYRATGEDEGATAEVRRTGPHKLHCVVVRSDGTVEDPSRELWARQPEGQASLLGAPAPVIRDHRPGGNDVRSAFQQKFLDARAAKSRQVTQVLDPSTNQLVTLSSARRLQMQNPNAAQSVDASQLPLSQTPEAQKIIAQQLQQYSWAKDLYDPSDAGQYYQGSKQDDGTVQYDDGSQYDDQQYGGYGGVDPNWHGASDWVDPRAVAAFDMPYDDDISPVDQLVDEGGDDDDAQV